MKTKKRFEKLEELVHASQESLKIAVSEARKATRRAEAACEAADEAREDFKRVERLLRKEQTRIVAKKQAKKKKAAKEAARKAAKKKKAREKKARSKE